MANKIKQKGFTIIELLIVIVVIGILATLVITTYGGIQQKARDTKRSDDIRILQGQMEAYAAKNNNQYPSLGNMNDANWRSQNLKGFDTDAMKDPRASSASLTQTAVANSSYGYDVKNAAGNAGCDNATAGNECTNYKLTAILEGGGTTEKSSLLN